ncbi:MAG: hypothetical protein GXP55_23615, partial [Deltaproteobacteria bacterium]|nr:hypothetical protein [Deltaproteobacteria bacterium]
MTLHHHTHPFNDTHNQSQHHLPLSLLPLSLLLVGALLAQPGRAGAQAQDPRALLRMAESAQANGQHRAALEIIVSLRGQVPAGQLAGMLSSSELALGDYLMAEQAAIAAMREAGDAWVSQHREALMNTLAQAALHLGEVVIEGL